MIEPRPVRVLIADARPKVRFALRVLLEQQPNVEIVGEVVRAPDLLAQARTVRPDVVLLSWELVGTRPMEFLLALRALCPTLAVIALSGRPEARRAALDAGANAFVSKTTPPEHLLVAMRECAHPPAKRAPLGGESA